MTPGRIPEAVIGELFKLAEAYNLREISVTAPEGKFRIRRGVEALSKKFPELSNIPKIREEKEVPRDKAGWAEIFSPLAGIFYAAPAPGLDPFVNAGERVQAGDTLCIIEAMKVMNEIVSDVSGTLQEIKVQNGEAVEAGKVLFIVRKDKPA